MERTMWKVWKAASDVQRTGRKERTAWDRQSGTYTVSEMLFVTDPELIRLGDRIQAKKNHKNINQNEKY